MKLTPFVFLFLITAGGASANAATSSVPPSANERLAMEGTRQQSENRARHDSFPFGSRPEPSPTP